jgi:transcriptional regulator with XRE-family HTH domain
MGSITSRVVVLPRGRGYGRLVTTARSTAAQRTAARRTAAPTVGDLLRHWRLEARRSQLDLASASGVSARHLSFVETGRARPSRSLLLHLAEHLGMPLRERNALVLTAGYAPAYAESDLGADHMRSAREALAHHEPYPALVLDRWGDVLMSNGGTTPLMAGVDPDLLVRPNSYRIGLHPGGLLPRIREPFAWIAHLGQRLTRALRWSGDPRLRELLGEIRTYPGVADVLDAGPELGVQELLLTVTLADPDGDPDGDLSLHTAVTTFGGPHDVTLAELAVESFFPADARTRARLQAAADPAPG